MRKAEPAAVRREAIEALRHAHKWLERHNEVSSYIGLDHSLGENEDGCTICHAAAALEGRVAPVEPADG